MPLILSEVARALHISRSAEGKYMSLACMASADLALAQTLNDADLEARLHRPAVPRSSHRLTPYFKPSRDIAISDRSHSRSSNSYFQVC